MRVLVVDDQRSARRVLSRILGTRSDTEIVESGSLAEARASLQSPGGFDAAFVDVRLSDDPRDRDGLVLLSEIRERSSTRVIMVTAFNEMPEIRAAMRAGAHDYLLKDDLCEEIVLSILEELEGRERLERELLDLRARTSGVAEHGLVGQSPAIAQLLGLVRRVALSTRPALIAGPSGAGKELVVRAIHAMGPRPAAPLLDLNCGAMPEALVEAQLFGHEKGAFTGADRRVAGYLTAVADGTLFLDEVAELPIALQAKLLRVLETSRFRPVGSVDEVRFEGRVVAATHADLGQRVREGRFREDLFHRLDVLRIRVPALDERRDDIPLLVGHFARQQARPMRFADDAVELLRRRSWPGNVRQLRNLIDRLAVFCDDDPIAARSIEALDGSSGSGEKEELAQLARSVLALPLEDKLGSIEAALIEEALRISDGNKTAAARLIGVHRKVIERRLSKPNDAPPA